jgi:predicted RNase H-like nuclease (RuvC/YqgF family)
MKHSVSVKSHSILEEDKIDDLQQSLEIIEQKLDAEILAKQKTIERQEQEIQQLHELVEGKNKIIIEINDKLVECIRNSEGNRQLINKLLNDISRLQQDVEWYKRTYVKRSLLGTIKQKLFRK